MFGKKDPKWEERHDLPPVHGPGSEPEPTMSPERADAIQESMFGKIEANAERRELKKRLADQGLAPVVEVPKPTHIAYDEGRDEWDPNLDPEGQEYKHADEVARANRANQEIMRRRRESGFEGVTITEDGTGILVEREVIEIQPPESSERDRQ